MRRRARIILTSLVVVALAVAAPLAPVPSRTAAGAEPADVVLMTSDCASGNFLCRPFAQAAKRTGATGRIISPDPREDPVGTLSLIAQQGHDLVIVDPGFAGPLGEVAPRFPDTHFALFDAPFRELEGRPRNVAATLIRPHQAAYLAGWLAARLERAGVDPDTIGVVGGQAIPPVEEFVIGFRAGALRASAGARVLVGYSDDFADPTKCAIVARRLIAQGAGTVFDVAGGCGPGTLAAARAAGVWAIGVDEDRSRLGPHILTSVVKRYDRGFAILMRQARDGTLVLGRTTVLGLRSGGAELGRISPRVPQRVLVELAGVRRGIVSGRIRVPGVDL